MKKIIPFVFFAIVALSTSTVSANEPGPKQDLSAVTTQNITPADNQLSPGQINTLTSRYNEIQNMDKSNLSSAQKHELKKEANGIKDILKQQDGVVIYLSGAAILIIILLIILL